jgi:hypothetical protein
MFCDDSVPTLNVPIVQIFIVYLKRLGYLQYPEEIISSRMKEIFNPM